MHREVQAEACPVHAPEAPHARERGIRLVVALTAAMMVIEIVVGQVTGSMALLADGWHMATHVGALGITSVAYALSRRFAGHRAFAFGTGKIHALAAYTSAAALAAVAVGMMVQSVARLLEPTAIQFSASLPVAIAGLLVNVASVWLLEGHGHEHEHEDGHGHGHGHGHGERHGHGDNHNHRAAVLHVVADALTSALAVVALLAGRWLGWMWLDPITGIVGGLVILKWGLDLCRGAAAELLDINGDAATVEQVQAALERIDDVRVRDLHVWPMGRGRRGCIVSLVSGTPREVDHYRAALAGLGFGHLTVEVRLCPHHGAAPTCPRPA